MLVVAACLAVVLPLILVVGALKVIEPQQSLDCARGSGLPNLRGAVTTCEARTGAVPGDARARGLQALVEAGIMKKIPVDPWGHEYLYEVRGESVCIVSLGRDGVPGGKDNDADIVDCSPMSSGTRSE